MSLLTSNNTWTGSNHFAGATYLDTFTTGSVLFIGPSGLVSQDNANLFFDNSNNRLGVGTNSPEETMHIKGPTIIEGSGLGTPRLYAYSQDGGNSLVFNRGSPTVAQPGYHLYFGENGDTGNVFFRGQGDYYFGDQTTPILYASEANDVVGIGTASPDLSAKLTIRKLTANTVPDCTDLSAVAGGDAGLTTYGVGNPITYRIWAYKNPDGTNYFSVNYFESTPYVITYGTEMVSVSWTAVNGASGYILQRDNSDSWSWYADVGNITGVVDDNSVLGHISWQLGSPTLSPTTYYTNNDCYFHMSSDGYNYLFLATQGQLAYLDGKMGLGGGVVGIPTAKLHIDAVSTSANSAPLKFVSSSGTVMTTPEDGAFEYDGTNLFFTAAGVRQAIAWV